LRETGRESIRQRELPAHVMVYYIIALALYMQSSYREILRCLREGMVWLFGEDAAGKPAAKSAIAQARERLGVEPLRKLYEDLVKPIATERTRGSRYRVWGLVSLDGSTLDVADTTANRGAFGSPEGRTGEGSYPQLRLISFVENGTHVLFGASCTKPRWKRTLTRTGFPSCTRSGWCGANCPSSSLPPPGAEGDVS
jgi:hypothetical protein